MSLVTPQILKICGCDIDGMILCCYLVADICLLFKMEEHKQPEALHALQLPKQELQGLSGAWWIKPLKHWERLPRFRHLGLPRSALTLQWVPRVGTTRQLIVNLSSGTVLEPVFPTYRDPHPGLHLETHPGDSLEHVCKQEICHPLSHRTSWQDNGRHAFCPIKQISYIKTHPSTFYKLHLATSP